MREDGGGEGGLLPVWRRLASRNNDCCLDMCPSPLASFRPQEGILAGCASSFLPVITLPILCHSCARGSGCRAPRPLRRRRRRPPTPPLQQVSARVVYPDPDPATASSYLLCLPSSLPVLRSNCSLFCSGVQSRTMRDLRDTHRPPLIKSCPSTQRITSRIRNGS